MMASLAPVMDGGGDPSSIVTAAQWLQGTLLGTTATILATLAVAWLGFLMLQGRLPVRRAGSVLLGCFILFGASAIAQGLVELAGRSDSNEAFLERQTAPELPPSPLLDDNDPLVNDNADAYYDATVPQP